MFRKTKASRWPFWLLIAAWFCANLPQLALFAFLGWVAEARVFSHQERLTLQVAMVLGGSAAAETLAESNPLPPRSPLPPVPNDTFTKRVDLTLERTSDFLPLALRADRQVPTAFAVPEHFRAPPPHGPPRRPESLI